MTTKHTPGPWHIIQFNTPYSKNEDVVIGRIVPVSVGNVDETVIPEYISRVSAGPARDANARLIAAAPELLQALKLCAQAFEERDTEAEEYASKRARSIISKVEGV